jgi:hypothetical protein
MRDGAPFSRDIQHYLDGEAVPVPPEERAAADRFADACARYAAGLAAPGAEVDRAVLAAVAGRRRRSGWRRLVEPQAVRVRPALAAAVLAVSLALAWWAGGHVRTAGVAPPAAAVGETVLVRFELRAPEARQVTVAGSFTGWDEPGIPLSLNPATGLWTVTVPLRPGQYEYLFRVDGERWVPDPSAHAQVDDGFGQENSVIVVGPRGVVRS